MVNIFYKIIIGIIIIILIVAFVMIYIVPQDNKAEVILQYITDIVLFPVPDDIKIPMIKTFIDNISNYDRTLYNLIRMLVLYLLDYLPDSIKKDIIDKLPNDMIDQEKCIRKPSNKFTDDTRIYLDSELPWDEKLDLCTLKKGIVKDIDLSERVVNKNPKIILY